MNTYILLLLTFIVRVSHCNNVATSQMMMMPLIDELNVKCTKEGILVDLSFTGPFNGVVYSKGYFFDKKCRYVYQSLNDKFQFTIPINDCGTNPVRRNGRQAFENLIVIQGDGIVQEIWDSSRKIICEVSETIPSGATVLESYKVSMLDFEEISFPAEVGSISVKMKLLNGEWPNVSPIQDIVKIGDAMSVCIEVYNPSGFDSQIRNCYAYDSRDINALATTSIRLTDDLGCPLKTKLLGAFQFDKSSTVDKHVHISIMNAFTFPDKMDVFIGCEVELCKGGCETCSGNGISPVENPTINIPSLEASPCRPGDIRPQCRTTIRTTTLLPTTIAPCLQGDERPECPVICTQEFFDVRCTPTTTTVRPCVIGDPRPQCLTTITVPFISVTTPGPCGPGDLRDECPIICNSIFTDFRCPPTTTTEKPCAPGDSRPQCPIICNEKYTDERCPRPTTTVTTAIRTTNSPCRPGDVRPDCPIVCNNEYQDIRCPRPTTTTSSPCVPGDLRLECPIICTETYTDIRCPKLTTTTTTEKPCVPGDQRPDCPIVCTAQYQDPRCSKPTTTTQAPCLPGDPRPECPIVCNLQYQDERCPQPSTTTRAPCVPGDPRPECPVVCNFQYQDERCSKLTTTTRTPCVPGDPRLECPIICTTEYQDRRCPKPTTTPKVCGISDPVSPDCPCKRRDSRPQCKVTSPLVNKPKPPTTPHSTNIQCQPNDSRPQCNIHHAFHGYLTAKPNKNRTLPPWRQAKKPNRKRRDMSNSIDNIEVRVLGRFRVAV
ncbi:mucin-2-like isoform X2 [Artemia franciscana]|uniref:mucin-2-like isoform X2 n=1 Tax=Artemia franciscana TaxID=6661 RepID=UPI0032DA5E75